MGILGAYHAIDRVRLEDVVKLMRTNETANGKFFPVLSGGVQKFLRSAMPHRGTFKAIIHSVSQIGKLFDNFNSFYLNEQLSKITEYHESFTGEA